MTDLAAAAAETTIAQPVADTTSPPDPAQQETPANGQTPGTPESNAQGGSGAGEPAAATPDGEQGDEAKEKKRQSVQERIDQVTAARRSAERRANAAEARAAELEKQLTPPPQHASLEEHDEYRMRKVFREEQVRQLRHERDDAADDAHQAMRTKFQVKAEAVADRMPGLFEKFAENPDLKVSAVMADFVAESEKGAEVAFHLVQNPREAARIAQLPPLQQGIELARLEGKLSVAPQIRKASTAPSPPPTVTGNPSPSAKSASELSVAEMQAAFKKKGLIR